MSGPLFWEYIPSYIHLWYLHTYVYLRSRHAWYTTLAPRSRLTTIVKCGWEYNGFSAVTLQIKYMGHVYVVTQLKPLITCHLIFLGVRIGPTINLPPIPTTFPISQLLPPYSNDQSTNLSTTPDQSTKLSFNHTR